MPILQLTTADGKRVTINARRESTVIMQNEDTSFTFDYEGRLIGAFFDGRNYRRSLANEILEKQSGVRPGLSGRLRRTLSRDEVQSLETRAYHFARTMAEQVNGAAPETIHEALARVQTYDYARLETERASYAHIYRPVTILPPDQYLALYLQATEGCTYNHCQFCGFYRDRRFYIKSADEFRTHILAVRDFFGGGLSLRRSIFLGDANALTAPQADLVPMFDAITSQFAILPHGLSQEAREQWAAAHPIHFNGIYSFVDAFSMHRTDPRHYAELAARGLRRVYIGLESGDQELLRFLGKPNTPRDVIELVYDLKAGGVAVGVIILVGAGGAHYQEAHIRETCAVINMLPLDENDLIYFSEMVDYPGSTYAQQLAKAGIAPLGIGEVEHQMVRLRAGFQFRDPERAPKVSYYDIREFVY